MRNLPLASLRVFEAVARLESFSRAAEQLGMTQSAVSQHVRALEDWTGKKLMQRGSRRSFPSVEGKRLSKAVADGVATIDGVLQELRAAKTQDRGVTIACPAGFAVNWLFPRLYHFDRGHSDSPVSVVTQPVDGTVITADADVAILYSAHRPEGLKSVKLFGEYIFPVCAPSLQDGAAKIITTADLGRHTLLVDTYGPSRVHPPDWEFWAAETGQILPNPVRTRRFGQANLTIQAAIQGEGVGLGRGPLVMDALRSGALVAPLPYRAKSRQAYWFAFMPGVRTSSPAQELLEWLRDAIVDLESVDGFLIRAADTSERN